MKKLKIFLDKIIFLKNWLLKKPFLFKLLIIIFLLPLSWGIFSLVKSSTKNKISYQTARVEKGTIISSVTASGQALSVNIMSANTKASGIVKTVYVKDGDIVKKGDKILEIDLDFQGQQKYAAALAAYQAAKNNLESAKTTAYTLQSEMFSKWKTFYDLSTNSTYQNSDGTPNYTNRSLPEFHIAEKNWLAAEAKYKQQQEVINQAQLSVNSSWLEYLQTSPIITAPTDGIITSLMYAPGMTIGSLDVGNSTSNQKVATIKTQGKPIISVNLSEIDVPKVQLDQKATVTFDSLPDKTFTGKVIGVDRIGQTTSGVTQYPANIALDLESEEILPNMTATATIIIEKKDNALIVPSTAVKSENNQTFVQLLVKGKPQSRLVVIGLTSDTQTEIISGVREGETIIIGTITKENTSTRTGSSPFSGFGGSFRMR